MLLTNFDVSVFWNRDKKKIQYSLLRDYMFRVGGLEIVVPNGYTTDFASVPRFLWSILPPIGKHNPAALVHDFLYDGRVYSRKKCDDIFFKLMLLYEVNLVTACTMYVGVRIFAHSWYKN